MRPIFLRRDEKSFAPLVFDGGVRQSGEGRGVLSAAEITRVMAEALPTPENNRLD